METLGEVVYENNRGDKIYAVATRDKSSMRVSADLYIKSADGDMSDIMTVTRRNIMTGKNCLDFLLDRDIDLGMEQIGEIREKVLALLKENANIVEVVEEKAPLNELYNAISSYIRENKEELSDNPHAQMFIKENYGYMRTQSIEGFVREHKLLGYKRQDILKRLKIMGVLKTGTGRPYDTLVSISGKKVHCYKIMLAEESGEEETGAEVICIDN